MHETLSRRQLLRTTGTLGLAVAVSGLFGKMAGSAVAFAAADFALLRTKWVDQLTGRKVIVAGDPDFARAIKSLNSAVAKSRGLLDTSSPRTMVFTDAPFSADTNVVTTYKRLAQMATAWATPGTDGYQNATLLQQVIAGLDDTNTLIYNTGQSEFGNWWNWEIGSSKALADAMAVVYDKLTADQISRYCAAIDHFVPDPWVQFPPSRGQITSVGANRVDLCQAVIIRSIVGQDGAKLAHARDGLSATWQYVTDLDGLYRDGSFIQHHKVPYTGTYGIVLLGGLAKLFALLGGTSEAVTDPSRQNLIDSVERAFVPFVYDGAMMDCVRGRAVSREKENGHDDGYITVEAVLRLADGVGGQLADTWRGICLGWIRRDTYGDILKSGGIPRMALVKTLLSSGVAAGSEKSGHRLFGAMDRAVHRRPGWAYAIAMCSERIAWYECGNGENNKGYFNGSGMTYLYDKDNAHWDDDFWPTVNLLRLPGTTVDTTALPDMVEGEWGANSPAAAWVGGVTLDGYGAVGHHLLGPGGTGLTARKSWFCADDVVVALGADIRSTSGNAIETIVENRNLHATGDNAITVDGTARVPAPGDTATVAGAKWAHVAGVAGYLFPKGADLHLLREERTGSWQDNNAGGPATQITRRYATLWLDHGVNSTGAGYAYAVVPGASAQRTAELYAAQPFQILANTPQAQAVRFPTLGLIAVNFWAAGTLGDITVDQPAAVMVRQRSTTIEIALADPTHKTATVRAQINRAGWSNPRGDSTVTASTTPTAIQLQVNTAGSLGDTHRVQLSR